MLGADGRVPAASTENKQLTPWLAESWTSNADASEWTFKIRQGVKFNDGTPHDGEGRRRVDQPDGRSGQQVERPVGVRPACCRRTAATAHRRRHRGVQARRADGSFPYYVSSDNYNSIILPGGVRGRLHEDVPGHRPVEARLLPGGRGRVVHPQRRLLGQEGAAGQARGHVRGRRGGAGAGAAGQPARRRPAGVGLGRAGDPGRPGLPDHRAAVRRPPPAVDAHRHEAVRRRPRAPGDRPGGRPPGDRGRALPGQVRPRERLAVRADLRRRPTRASPSARRTSTRPSRSSPRPASRTASRPNWSRSRPRRSRSTPRSSSTRRRRSASTSSSRSRTAARTTAMPCTASRTGSTR